MARTKVKTEPKVLIPEMAMPPMSSGDTAAMDSDDTMDVDMNRDEDVDASSHHEDGMVFLFLAWHYKLISLQLVCRMSVAV